MFLKKLSSFLPKLKNDRVPSTPLRRPCSQEMKEHEETKRIAWQSHEDMQVWQLFIHNKSDNDNGSDKWTETNHLLITVGILYW